MEINDSLKEVLEKDTWRKVVHVKSSLEPKPNQYAMFIGRFQPLHVAHTNLFAQAMAEGKNVLVCVRDGEVDEKNPFTAEEVRQKIEEHYFDLNYENSNAGLPTVKVMIIPDICSVEFGRGVGYDIIEHVPPVNIAEISATKIREKMREKGEL
jgi:cytidyltransferase-like protein